MCRRVFSEADFRSSSDWCALPADGWLAVYNCFVRVSAEVPSTSSFSLAFARKRVRFAHDVRTFTQPSEQLEHAVHPCTGYSQVQALVRSRVDQHCDETLAICRPVRVKATKVPRYEHLRIEDDIACVEAALESSCRSVAGEVCESLQALHLDPRAKEFASSYPSNKLKGINKWCLVQSASRKKRKPT